MKPLQGLPWIGNYFGIEEPKDQKPFLSKKIIQIEMHVLHRDLSVKTYQLRHSPEEHGCDQESIELMLRGMAYLDPNAVAHMRYIHEIDPVTGVRLKATSYRKLPSIRLGENKWKWHDNQNNSPEFKALIEQEYSSPLYAAVRGPVEY